MQQKNSRLPIFSPGFFVDSTMNDKIEHLIATTDERDEEISLVKKCKRNNGLCWI